MNLKIKFITLFTTVLCATVTSYGANPFSDVASDSWVYQSLELLSDAGIVQGYPDNTFHGERTLTRYELAQVVAKAMANQERANAEQQVVINRLSTEFSDELENLGVRVDRLEERIGRVTIAGDMRLTYIDKEGIDDKPSEGKFTNRARLMLDANVTKNTSAHIRFTSGALEIGEGENNKKLGYDLAWVDHKLNNTTSLHMGRYTQSIGRGLIYSSNFDGIGVTTKMNRLTLDMAYGYLTAGRFIKVSKGDNSYAAVINVSTPINKHITVGGTYVHKGTSTVRMGNGRRNNDFGSIYGFNIDYRRGKYSMLGEWITTSRLAHSNVWNVGVHWGNYKISKKNSWQIGLDYFNQDVNAPVFKTQKYETNDLYKSTRFEGYRAWQASVSYAPEKNVGINLFYGFHGTTHKGNKVNNYLRGDVLFKF